MTNEIIEEVQRNMDEMDNLIKEQKFTIKDAEKYKERYLNILRSMEDLETSRDKWKKRALIAEDKNKNYLKGKKALNKLRGRN